MYTIIITVFITLSCYLIGTLIEAKHDRSLEQREKELKNILIFNGKYVPSQCSGQKFKLVTGSVVMSSDCFKKTLANIISLFGGNIGVYESMLERGRREAVLRMKAEAKRLGANAVFNVRFETCSLNDGYGARSKLVCAELFVYGTVCKLKQN